MTLSHAGQPGHGYTASLRRQPARIEGGRPEGGYPAFLSSSARSAAITLTSITPRSRAAFSGSAGPYTMRAGLAAYEKRFGLTSC